LYVEDHARGIELVLNHGKVGDTYNIGGNNEWQNIDIVKLVCELVNQAFTKDAKLKQKYPAALAAIDGNSQSLIEYVSDRLGHDRRYAINAEKITSELGYQPVESFETGIEKTVDWFLQNQTWWESV